MPIAVLFKMWFVDQQHLNRPGSCLKNILTSHPKPTDPEFLGGAGESSHLFPTCC